MCHVSWTSLLGNITSLLGGYFDITVWLRMSPVSLTIQIIMCWVDQSGASKFDICDRQLK